jgi:ankyrin repeat protein
MRVTTEIDPDQIHKAAAIGDIQALTVLFEENPACLNQPHSKNKTFPVDYATQRGQLDALIWLVDHGANLNTPKISKFAFSSRKSEIITYLEEQQVPLSPLHVAFCKGDLESIKRFLDQGADIFVRDKRTNMAIDYAILFQKKHVFPFLFKHGITLNTEITAEDHTRKGANLASIFALSKRRRCDWLREFAKETKNPINLNVIVPKDNITLAHGLILQQEWELLKEQHLSFSTINPDEMTTTGFYQGMTLAARLVVKEQWEDD